MPAASFEGALDRDLPTICREYLGGSSEREVVMALTALGLIGLEAVSQDGKKIGKIKDVISASESSSRYLVVRHSLRHNLVVPADAAQRQGDTVTVPFAGSLLEGAPRVATKRALSAEDTHRLEDYYRAA